MKERTEKVDCCLNNNNGAHLFLMFVSKIFVFFFVFSSFMFLCTNVSVVSSTPNDRQTHELLLLDSLGRKPQVGLSYDENDPLISMLGRSK